MYAESSLGERTAVKMRFCACVAGLLEKVRRVAVRRRDLVVEVLKERIIVGLGWTVAAARRIRRVGWEIMVVGVGGFV